LALIASERNSKIEPTTIRRIWLPFQHMISNLKRTIFYYSF
jgi:hypothetical protein